MQIQGTTQIWYTGARRTVTPRLIPKCRSSAIMKPITTASADEMGTM